MAVSKSQVASSTPFDPDGTTFKSASNDVQAAVEELRTTIITPPQVVTSSLNGTDYLTVDSLPMYDVHGTATGYSIQLPDATTLNEGRTFFVSNDSTEEIYIKDADGTVLIPLGQEEFGRFILEHNDTTAGEWILNVTSSTAEGIRSYVVEDAVTFVTSSNTDVLVTGFTVTPISGRYACWLSANIQMTQANKDGEYVVYVDGAFRTQSRRTIQSSSANFITSANTLLEVTVDGTEAVDFRVNTSAGNIIVYARSMVLIRLGPA